MIARRLAAAAEHFGAKVTCFAVGREGLNAEDREEARAFVERIRHRGLHRRGRRPSARRWILKDRSGGQRPCLDKQFAKGNEELNRTAGTLNEQSNNGFEYLAVDSSFTSVFRNHCERSKKSRYDVIAAAAHLDPAYVYRLIKGEKFHPSPNTIIRLALALQLTVAQADELLMAAGYMPLVSPRKSRQTEKQPV